MNTIVPAVSGMLHVSEGRKVICLFLMVIDKSGSMAGHTPAVK